MRSQPDGPDDGFTPQAFMDGCARVLLGWLAGIALLFLATWLGPRVGMTREAAVCFGAALWQAGLAWFRIPSLAGGWGFQFLHNALGDDTSQALHTVAALLALAAGIYFQFGGR